MDIETQRRFEEIKIHYAQLFGPVNSFAEFEERLLQTAKHDIPFLIAIIDSLLREEEEWR